MATGIGILTALCCVAVAASTAATAGVDHPGYGPPPAWVKPLPIPDIAAAPNGAPVQILLEDTQTRFGPDGDETYNESAVRLLTPQALVAMASISLAWNPDTQTLNLHRISILRNGKVIDLLAGGKSVTVLRRETNLETAMLDGELTATIQPEGLQVGDILDIVMTTTRRDPVLQGRSEAMTQIRHVGLAGRIHIREFWPDSKPIRWRATEGVPSPTVTRAGGVSELTVDATDFAAPKPPRDAPPRYNDVGQLETSQFQSWAEVAGLMAPLYEKATRLAPNSPLHKEAERIARTALTPKARAEAALRLAEDQIHYVFLGMNFGGYIPADADLTWTRRFGDCKGKTALLLSLLGALGIEAQPALVSTGLGDGLDQRLPTLSVFDHVIVRARIDGKTYWLDATRTGDRDLDETPPPDFHWVLPVQASAAVLAKVEPPPFAEPAFESFERLDASAGYEAAAAHVEHIFRGDKAVVWRLNLESQGRADAERSLREYWRGQVSWIEPKTVDYAYDDQRRIMRMTMEGTAKMAWVPNAGLREFDIADSNLGFNAVFKREPGPHADAPFSVDFPSYDKWTVEIRLPAGGDDFRLAGAPTEVDQTIAGRRYLRHTRLADGVATMVAEEQSLAPEFPFSQADPASAALRDLSRYNVVVRGPPGPAPPPADEDEDLARPTDARGFENRGAGYLSRGEDDKAIADFSEAARLDPKASRHLYDRGAAYFQKGDMVHAQKDFDAALQLEPADIQALMGRADLEVARGDITRADADYAQALLNAPGSSLVFARRAAASARAGGFVAAARDYDNVSVQGAKSARQAELLNARCFARAEWGHELEAGLDQCQAALKLLPEQPDILDSRGFIYFRLRQWPQAISDYDAALRTAPKNAPALFGRGLAEFRLGQAEAGMADIAAARAASPGIDAMFAHYGVKAPAAHRPANR